MATTCYVATVLHFHTYLLLLIRKHLVNTHLFAGEILTGIYKIRPVARDLIAGRCVLISACIFLYKLVQNGKHNLKLFPDRFFNDLGRINQQQLVTFINTKYDSRWK